MRKGLEVNAIGRGSQAAKAGILVGDRILSYNGIDVSSLKQLKTENDYARGQGIEVSQLLIEREDKQITIEILPAEDVGITWAQEQQGDDQSAGASHESKYGTTRSLCSFLALVGWLLVFVGVIILGTEANSELNHYQHFDLNALLPGIGIAIGGLITIMGAQTTKATVDNADQTREILIELKRNR